MSERPGMPRSFDEDLAREPEPVAEISPADELRAAAKLMRERAGLVPPSPWYAGRYDVTTSDGLNVIASSGLAARAQYVASMHPGVALAVADWLEQHAAEQYDDLTPEAAAFVAGEHGGDIDPALAVARAYLRAPAGETP